MIGGFSALCVKSNGLIPVKPPKSVQFGNFFCEILLDEITGGRAPNLNGRILIRNYGNEIRCSCKLIYYFIFIHFQTAAGSQSI